MYPGLQTHKASLAAVTTQEPLLRSWHSNTGLRCIVAVPHVALVTNTQGFIGCGNYTGAIVTAVDTQTRVRDALVAVACSLGHKHTRLYWRR